MSTRIKKLFDPGSEGINSTHRAMGFQCGVKGQPQRCAVASASAAECWATVGALAGLEGATITHAEVSGGGAPPGCSVSVRPGALGAVTAGTTNAAADATAHAVFNSNASSTVCCAETNVPSLSGCGSFLSDKVLFLPESCVQLQYPLVSSYRSTLCALANVILCTLLGPLKVGLGLDISGPAATATITLRGPAGVWFGVGLGARLMGDAPYTLVVEGDTGAVSERKLARHAPGSLLAPSVTVVSSAVSADGSLRTVVLQRPLAGKTEDYYSFDADFSLQGHSLNFIAALGATAAFGPHGPQPHSSELLTLWPQISSTAAAPACVCTLQPAPFGRGSGGLQYVDTGSVVGMGGGRCPDEPRGDLIKQRNPTCDVRTYVGGMQVMVMCCIVLDHDLAVLSICARLGSAAD